MSKYKVIVGVLLSLALFAQPGCSPAESTTAAFPRVEPLRVRRVEGAVQEIPLADAMAYHHRHEDHVHEPSLHDHDHEEELCAGVATGYQAIRFAGTKLFPDGVPDASDITLSVQGGMPGV